MSPCLSPDDGAIRQQLLAPISGPLVLKNLLDLQASSSSGSRSDQGDANRTEHSARDERTADDRDDSPAS